MVALQALFSSNDENGENDGILAFKLKPTSLAMTFPQHNVNIKESRVKNFDITLIITPNLITLICC